MLFQLGQIVATPNALRALDEVGDDPSTYIFRHASGDWGALDEHDRAVNDRAIQQGQRLLSAYDLSDGTRIWIITEAGRHVTTILLPSDY